MAAPGQAENGQTLSSSEVDLTRYEEDDDAASKDLGWRVLFPKEWQSMKVLQSKATDAFAIIDEVGVEFDETDDTPYYELKEKSHWTEYRGNIAFVTGLQKKKSPPPIHDTTAIPGRKKTLQAFINLIQPQRPAQMCTLRVFIPYGAKVETTSRLVRTAVSQEPVKDADWKGIPDALAILCQDYLVSITGPPPEVLSFAAKMCTNLELMVKQEKVDNYWKSPYGIFKTIMHDARTCTLKICTRSRNAQESVRNLHCTADRERERVRVGSVSGRGGVESVKAVLEKAAGAEKGTVEIVEEETGEGMGVLKDLNLRKTVICGPLLKILLVFFRSMGEVDGDKGAGDPEGRTWVLVEESVLLGGPLIAPSPSGAKAEREGCLEDGGRREHLLRITGKRRQRALAVAELLNRQPGTETGGEDQAEVGERFPVPSPTSFEGFPLFGQRAAEGEGEGREKAQRDGDGGGEGDGPETSGKPVETGGVGRRLPGNLRIPLHPSAAASASSSSSTRIAPPEEAHTGRVSEREEGEMDASPSNQGGGESSRSKRSNAGLQAGPPPPKNAPAVPPDSRTAQSASGGGLPVPVPEGLGRIKSSPQAPQSTGASPPGQALPPSVGPPASSPPAAASEEGQVSKPKSGQVPPKSKASAGSQKKASAAELSLFSSKDPPQQSISSLPKAPPPPSADGKAPGKAPPPSSKTSSQPPPSSKTSPKDSAPPPSQKNASSAKGKAPASPKHSRPQTVSSKKPHADKPAAQQSKWVMSTGGNPSSSGKQNESEKRKNDAPVGGTAEKGGGGDEPANAGKAKPKQKSKWDEKANGEKEKGKEGQGQGEPKAPSRWDAKPAIIPARPDSDLGPPNQGGGEGGGFQRGREKEREKNASGASQRSDSSTMSIEQPATAESERRPLPSQPPTAVNGAPPASSSSSSSSVPPAAPPPSGEPSKRGGGDLSQSQEGAAGVGRGGADKKAKGKGTGTNAVGGAGKETCASSAHAETAVRETDEKERKQKEKDKERERNAQKEKEKEQEMANKNNPPSAASNGGSHKPPPQTDAAPAKDRPCPPAPHQDELNAHRVPEHSSRGGGRVRPRSRSRSPPRGLCRWDQSKGPLSKFEWRMEEGDSRKKKKSTDKDAEKEKDRDREKDRGHPSRENAHHQLSNSSSQEASAPPVSASTSKSNSREDDSPPPPLPERPQVVLLSQDGRKIQPRRDASRSPRLPPARPSGAFVSEKDKVPERTWREHESHSGRSDDRSGKSKRDHGEGLRLTLPGRARGEGEGSQADSYSVRSGRDVSRSPHRESHSGSVLSEERGRDKTDGPPRRGLQLVPAQRFRAQPQHMTWSDSACEWVPQEIVDDDDGETWWAVRFSDIKRYASFVTNMTQGQGTQNPRSTQAQGPSSAAEYSPTSPMAEWSPTSPFVVLNGSSAPSASSTSRVAGPAADSSRYATNPARPPSAPKGGGAGGGSSGSADSSGGPKKTRKAPADEQAFYRSGQARPYSSVAGGGGEGGGSAPSSSSSRKKRVRLNPAGASSGGLALTVSPSQSPQPAQQGAASGMTKVERSVRRLWKEETSAGAGGEKERERDGHQSGLTLSFAPKYAQQQQQQQQQSEGQAENSSWAFPPSGKSSAPSVQLRPASRATVQLGQAPSVPPSSSSSSNPAVRLAPRPSYAAAPDAILMPAPQAYPTGMHPSPSPPEYEMTSAPALGPARSVSLRPAANRNSPRRPAEDPSQSFTWPPTMNPHDHHPHAQPTYTHPHSHPTETQYDYGAPAHPHHADPLPATSGTDAYSYSAYSHPDAQMHPHYAPSSYDNAAAPSYSHPHPHQMSQEETTAAFYAAPRGAPMQQRYVEAPVPDGRAVTCRAVTYERVVNGGGGGYYGGHAYYR
uniref:Uncharacterized protein n=1 Tax=Chromera velia CCMP2878 TaxID=1169474 RepID=A0A0G4IDF4_9ALVE|eukprot:Cvel_13400.t1-p1 / transcript=Cvel_13400.t1 / gene=Cvel_13400 / organism=Chromera_velia_CCMP2878 / gene_product=hypothetical protein / transcript_product=hypothetical protein / location=Cvel_scaffold913:15022-22705(+) / protein_length=1870 / sequence_SO=supercontig / SO=protein_coding / is_pseudo=false